MVYSSMIRAILFGLCWMPFLLWADVAQEWQQELTSPQDSSLLQQYLSNRQVVFVTGILPGISQRYFADNVDSVHWELHAASTKVFSPQSNRSIDQGSDWLYSVLKPLLTKTPRRPMILIGHSKGGVEAILVALKYPELMEKGKIEKIIAIQSPVRGTPVVQYAQGVHPQIYRLWKQGLDSLSEKNVQEIIGRHWLKLTDKQKERIRKRIYFVRSAASLSEIDVRMKWLAKQIPNPNDGVVPTANQKNDELGIDLGILHADHAALVTGTKYGYFNNYIIIRRAFTRAVFFELFSMGDDF
jgi:pimeloyl-ACP methyl ester carboxylesterase